jgi:hypothetical protein
MTTREDIKTERIKGRNEAMAESGYRLTLEVHDGERTVPSLGRAIWVYRDESFSHLAIHLVK